MYAMQSVKECENLPTRRYYSQANQMINRVADGHYRC
jgi:hypothetical protein